MSLASTLIDIVINTPGGLLIHCPNVNELCREICEATGVMLRPEKQFDHYESENTNYYGEAYINTRINQRKFLLKKSI